MKNKMWLIVVISGIAFISLFSFVFLLNLYLDHSHPYEYNYYYHKIFNGIDLKRRTLDKSNEYSRFRNYEFVQYTNSLYTSSKQESLNMLYSFLDSGEDSVGIYCDNNYKGCIGDMHDHIYRKDKLIIGSLYGFVHPYNDYLSLYMSCDRETGFIELKAKHEYTKEKIDEVNKKVDEIYSKLVNPNDSNRNNIKRIHDYLIDNIVYEKSEDDTDKDYNNAYGALINGKAVCGGYTDAMYLFLEKMGIESVRIANSTHIWNAVKLDGKWYHLDVTWDDARYTTGETFTSYQFFLIDSKTLAGMNVKEHDFDHSIYKEIVNID